MREKFHKAVFFSIVLACFFLMLPCGLALGEAGGNISWQTIETKHTIIHYQTLKDLKKFNDKIDYGPGQSGFMGLFSRPDSNMLMDKIKKKSDSLFERAQEILDMRKAMQKVKIYLYSNKAQLHSAYYGIYKKKCRLRAWYLYQYHSIYINLEDLHEGILAHEMAHSIIDHYLITRPPGATAEILARYVDTHLFR